MRLQRLDITGFKSFNDRVVIGFDEGTTGIVGPNGCGKSNVVDAIRWAMGEQSAKHLRGRSMEDVIFGGSESRPPSGMAEVALTLQNDRPSEVPPQYRGFSEITIQRRLFRSGESEYRINQAACRLLDITELFLGTGVGTRAYSIIEQGRIGLILNSKPEDRRAIIEEAAGITKYKARKRAAERKMEYTEQNLLRVGDIVGELKKRLDGLERQARKAERYRRLKDELREIELHLAVVRWLELQASSTSLRRELAEITDRERQSAMANTELDGAISEARERLARHSDQLDALASRRHELDKEIGQGTQAIEFARRESEGLAERKAALLQELELLQARSISTERERVTVLEQRAVLEELVGASGVRLGRVELALGELATNESHSRDGVELERAAVAAAIARSSAAESDIANLAKRRVELDGRLGQTQEEIDEQQARLREALRNRDEHAGKLDATRQLKLRLEARRDEIETTGARKAAELAEVEAALIVAREELATHRSRLQSLQELQRNYEGCDQGVRAIMLRRQEGDPSFARIRGLVADLLRVPAAVEVAVEAVLGERLQQVVVDGREDAVTAVQFLAASSAGRGTFLPIDVVASAAPTAAAPQHAGVVGAALELIEVVPEHRRIAEFLLGNVLIVQDLSSALELQTAGTPATLVTLAGEVLWASGVLAGGTPEGRGAGELQKRREIGELVGRVRLLEARLIETEANRANLAGLVRQLQADLKILSKDSHVEEVNLAHREKDAGTAEAEAARCQQRIEQLEADHARLAGVALELQGEKADAEGLVLQASADRESHLSLQNAAEAELRAFDAQRKLLNDEWTALKVAAAADEERRGFLAAQAAQLEQVLAEVQGRLGAIAGERTQCERRVEQLGEESAILQRSLAGLGEELKAATQRQDLLVEERAIAAKYVSRLEDALRSERRGLEQLRIELGAVQLRDREQELELGHLVRSIAERHDLDLRLEIARFHALPLPGAEREERLVELKESIGRMGEVNLTAIEEHREISERHEFLSGQKDDLERSLLQLREAIARMNRASRQRFRETFELVNERFSQVFPRLFAGGKAELQLVVGAGGDAGDLLEAGVEIVAQPPGKRLQSVGLLSGGEKALTAIALVFAIFLIKPSPFCLLDEVDAPLDEANVGRYNDLVREMSKISQFILITHNKRTMEIADTLYGVTMEDPGCSKLVSVRLTERRESSAA
jgi:chromosome segregation protein